MSDTPFVNLGTRVRVGDLLVQGQLLGTAVAGIATSFFYVATGLEGGTNFIVALPQVRSSTSYAVQVTGNGLAQGLVFDVIGKQVNRFTLACSAQPTAGDIIAITVQDV